AFLNYKPYGAKKAYPSTLCASVNDGVVHGLPSEYVVKEGDLIKLDLGLIHKKFYLDSAITVPVGEVSADAKRMVHTTAQALQAGIRQAQIGNTLGDIGWAIQEVVEGKGFSVADLLTGHGIGKALHEDPSVFNVGKPHTGEELVEGMVIAI